MVDIPASNLDEKLEAHFKIPNFTPQVEPMATTWGFKNKNGRHFKISTDDLIKAFEAIIKNWDAWEGYKLNQNNVNPDHTLKLFADKYFKDGAHAPFANDQRRTCLHLISAIAYLASTDSDFDEKASELTLTVDYYKSALDELRKIAGASAIANKQRKDNVVVEQVVKPHPAGAGRNIIYYGAPGTGKSHRVDGLISEATTIRTVFHPDTQNSDFFGCLKPSMDNGKVVYGFVPGPFAKALLKASLDDANHHYLVIEELNRAPAAAVFGEMFQLLDRADDGIGAYSVDFPTTECESWFEANSYPSNKLRMPSNLTIYATMNSADQGVYPLDTAFRRRWEQVYLPLAEGIGPKGIIKFVSGTGDKEMEWRDFVGVLNEYLLATLRPPEDRLLGLWFVKERELSKGYVPAKILLYLVDDLLRHDDKALIFADGLRTYGEISRSLAASEVIFSDSFLEKLLAKLEGKVAQEQGVVAADVR